MSRRSSTTPALQTGTPTATAKAESGLVQLARVLARLAAREAMERALERQEDEPNDEEEA